MLPVSTSAEACCQGQILQTQVHGKVGVLVEPKVSVAKDSMPHRIHCPTAFNMQKPSKGGIPLLHMRYIPSPKGGKGGGTCGAKGLNGKELPLLHAGSLPTLHDGHRLAGMDLVGPDAVAVQIPDGLHLRCGGTVIAVGLWRLAVQEQNDYDQGQCS